MKLTRREVLFLGAVPLLAQSRTRIAVTMDDVRWEIIPEDLRAEAEERLLTHLGRTRAFLFAVGQYVDNEHGSRILKSWSAGGHLIGNHTYTHQSLTGNVTPAEFEQGILRTDEVLQKYTGFRRWFRFPALKEGRSPKLRDRFRAFLALHGYRNGAVTIDCSDWYYNQRLLSRLEANPHFDLTLYRQPDLDHIWNRARFYDQLSRDVLGRSVAHTLLIHYNLLNSLFLGNLLTMFRSRGWEIIHADDAFSDRVFERQPNTAPAGESLIWALAKETGRFEDRLRYPGEDDTYEKPILDRLGL
ncbi:MAG TPA: polysaccharide deacetylase family protein [Bryobacteraceae bacterium]|nr:polysaccharide deacetylase family protein [Bryobacteraceae bacterium]